jgi:NAD+ synthase (glutamine-hydrolysing)
MKIAMAQIVPKLGDVDANVDRHLDILDKARKAKADLVVFPELG